jgi:hypothetical protein
MKKISLSAVLSIGHESGIISTGATTEVLPLSQTHFFPDLMHVKVVFPTVDLIPTFLQVDPAFTAELAGALWIAIINRRVNKEETTFFNM